MPPASEPCHVAPASAEALAAIGVHLGGSRDDRGGRPENALVLSYRWFSTTYGMLLAVALALPCAAFCVLTDFGGRGLQPPLLLGAGAREWALWVGLPTAAAGLFVAFLYCGLCGLLNRTTLCARRDGTLSVRHHPVPTRGARDIDLTELVAFTCQRRSDLALSLVFSPEDFRSVTRNHQPVFDLCAVLRGGRVEPLCRGFASEGHVMLLKGALDDYLGRERRSG